MPEFLYEQTDYFYRRKLMIALIGAIIGIYALSYIFRLTLFRKLDAPKKQIYSILLLYPVAIIVSGYGRANVGEPGFLTGFILYGIATIVVIAITLVIFYLRKDKKKYNG
jgi:tellurite resistance protein TehA-like permease